MSKKASLAVMNKQLHERDAKAKQQQQSENRSPYIPRGERGDFHKITITLPPEMLLALKTIGA